MCTHEAFVAAVLDPPLRVFEPWSGQERGRTLVRVTLTLRTPANIFRATNRALRAFVLPCVLPMEGSTQNVPSTRPKLQGYDFYREVLGSPKYVVAPMVDQSELVCGLSLECFLVLIGDSRHGGHCLDDMVHK